jgi:hypothetical protein
MGKVDIITVDDRRSMNEFIDLPWAIYAVYPNWVPPLKRDIRELLDPSRHPFWKRAERTLFLARRTGRTVGRIAAIVDDNYNQFHREKMAVWGFWECADDLEAAGALFNQVAEWARAKGMVFLRGPLNPSTNYEVGMLIDGFDTPPTLMMPYNPPYYVRLAELHGFSKEKDLLTFWVDREYRPPVWVEQLIQRLKEKHSVWIRPVRPNQFEAELGLIKEIYHAAWTDNWGFVPASDDELRHMAGRMEKIMDPELVFFIYYRQEPVGFCLILPDINPLLRRINGRFNIVGLWQLLTRRHEIKGLRGLLFGVKEEYRQLGVPLMALDHLGRVLNRRKQYQYLELGWNLEDNEAINTSYAEGGLKINKSYRIFRKQL